MIYYIRIFYCFLYVFLHANEKEVIHIYYFWAFALAFMIVYTTIPLLKVLAYKIDFVDKPVENNERKIHREPVPLMAGIALFIGFLCTYAVFSRGTGGKMTAILTGSIMILAIGMVDDWYKTRRREFPALPKFIVQLSAAVIVYNAGVVFTGFNNPFTNQYVLLPQWFQFILSVTWIFGVTTVINFSDGIDGLAGGLSSISAATLFIVALAKGQKNSAVMAVALVGITLAYLHYNKHPAKIFMGDAGATFLGFILGIIALDGAFKQATVLSLFIPILALGVPIFDNILVVVRRFKSGKPIYQADASQVHFRLLSAGLKPAQVVTFLCLLNTCFCLTSLILLFLKV
jgi:UDP-N-acetylmuramyl pentapeptide phosphotransferase/UDP-N-acetylglucosamine-1-phosphate transferase